MSSGRSLLLPVLLGTACASSAHPLPTTPAAVSSTADGAVLALIPILATDRSEFFALSYSSCGLRVNGFLGRPRDRAARHPAVIWNRGGNREFGLADPRALIAYVEAGYVAVASQYRGNGGSEGREAFGGADVEDVLNLVPLLKQQPDVDPTRIAMVGYSRGGMMTYLALREDARRGRNDIRAAATVGGMADLDDLERRPDMGPVYEELIGCLPFECPEAYVARSAIHWAEDIRVPVLLLHGEGDWRVPVDQGRRLATAMKTAGRTVKLLTYPGDDHGLTNHDGGEPDILEWLGQRLGEPQERTSPR